MRHLTFSTKFKTAALLILGLQISNLATANALPACNPQNSRIPGAWFLTKTEWTDADEKEWQDWILALYNSKCSSLGDCLASPTNKFRQTDPPDLLTFSDCADFPYKLRMYFSWKKGLPFSYISKVSPRPLSPAQIAELQAEGKSTEQADLRYTKNGNQPDMRRTVPSNSGYAEFPKEFKLVTNAVSTSTLRLNPVIFGNASLMPDFYAVKVDRSQIRLGTIAYDSTGHVSLVIRTYPDGRMDLFDSKSDGTIGRPKFPAFKYFKTFSRVDHGVVFQNWRPFKVSGAIETKYGNICSYLSIPQGDGLRTVPDSAISGVSYEQGVGTSWKPGQPLTTPNNRVYFVGNKQAENHQQFIQLRLSGGNLKINPIQDLEDRVQDLCMTFKERVIQVNGSLVAESGKMIAPLMQFPETGNLFFNVYGGDGQWFALSSPSKDIGIRKSAIELVKLSHEYLEKFKAQDPSILYTGTDLKKDIIATYLRTANSCTIKYKKSDGSDSQSLNINQLLARSIKFSFSPFDCPERRWGATSEEELHACTNDRFKDRWYQAMQPIRNNLVKDENANMSFTLEQIEANPSLLGPLNAPRMDIERQLRAL